MTTTTATPIRRTRAEDVRPGDTLRFGNGGRAVATGRAKRIPGMATLVHIDTQSGTHGEHPGEWLSRVGEFLDVEPHEDGPYELVVDFYVYSTGTLPDMLRLARGCGNARIFRTGELLPIIQRAGSDSEVLYLHRLTRGGITKVQRTKARHAA